MKRIKEADEVGTCRLLFRPHATVTGRFIEKRKEDDAGFEKRGLEKVTDRLLVVTRITKEVREEGRKRGIEA